jgi:hypothetical protein
MAFVGLLGNGELAPWIFSVLRVSEIWCVKQCYMNNLQPVKKFAFVVSVFPVCSDGRGFI